MDAGAAAHLVRRCAGRLQRHEASDVLRDDLHPDGCPQRIDAERAEIFVEVAQAGRQRDRLDPGLAALRSIRFATAPSPAGSSSRAM